MAKRKKKRTKRIDGKALLIDALAKLVVGCLIELFAWLLKGR